MIERLITIAMLFFAGSFLSAQECATPDVTLAYSQLTGMLNLQGDVLAHIRIGSDGTPTILDIQGQVHQLLKDSATKVISTIRYPAECAGREVDLEFSYRKEYPIGSLDSGTSTRLGPNHFQVVAPEWATDQQAVTVKLGRRGFWNRLFRRKP